MVRLIYDFLDLALCIHIYDVYWNFINFIIGNPLPKVTWWHGGALFDSSDEVTRSGTIINQMVYKSLSREDLFKVFVCQASNTNRTLPVSRKVKVVLNCKFPFYFCTFQIYLFDKNDCIGKSWKRVDIFSRVLHIISLR